MSQASDSVLLLDPPSSMTGPKPELLTALPDVPTLAILSHLPLQQLIVDLPLVHPHLAPYCQSVLKVTQRLVLHIGDQKEIKERQLNSPLRLPFAHHLVDSTGALLYPQTDYPTLHLATLNCQSVEQLSSLMPAIVHLTVVISHAPIDVLPQLTILLAHWAPTLRTLKLNIGPLYSDLITLSKAASSSIIFNLHHLIQEINRNLGALQHLTLDIGGALANLQFSGEPDEFLKADETSVPLRLSILGQLRQFYLNVGDCESGASFLLEQLEAYATEKLTTIGLGGDFNWNWNAVANSQFAGRFTIVPFNESLTSHHTGPLLRSFSKLQIYAFNWTYLNALDLVDHLRLLSSLSHLQCLKVDCFPPWGTPVPVPIADLPSISSVTVLEIDVDLGFDGHHNIIANNLPATHWETLFPSVQIAKVTHVGRFCTLCYADEDWTAKDTITDYAEVALCLRQLFAPLRGLASLRKIFYQRYAQSDSVAEFTPHGDFVRTHEDIG